MSKDITESATEASAVAMQAKARFETAEKPVAAESENLSNNPQITVTPDRQEAVVKLYYPIGDDGSIDTLTMRRPIVRDTLLAEKISEGSRSELFIARLANICEVSYTDFAGLDDLEDLESLTEAYNLLKNSDHKTAESNPMIALAADRRSCVVTLRHPKTLKDPKTDNEILYETLTLRRPTLKDSVDAEKESEFPTEILAYKYAALCGVPLSVISALDDIDDFTSLDQAFGMFRRPKINR